MTKNIIKALRANINDSILHCVEFSSMECVVFALSALHFNQKILLHSSYKFVFIPEKLFSFEGEIW